MAWQPYHRMVGYYTTTGTTSGSIVMGDSTTTNEEPLVDVCPRCNGWVECKIVGYSELAQTRRCLHCGAQYYKFIGGEPKDNLGDALERLAEE